ncbi:MAG TPA: cytochrome P460 family protein [Vicinamibacterales bacterium]
MKRRYITASAIVVASIFAVSLALAAQDRFSLRVPDGLAFSEFKGYDAWQTIAPSQTDDGLKAILGNNVMISAYNAGIPANGAPVPDGAMMAKLEWSKKSNDESPYAVNIPDKLKSASFMIKDAKRFAESGGWGYAQFVYDAASDTFKPTGNGSGCGYVCHTRVKARDFVFTRYARR